MQYALECIEPIVFNWREGVLEIMKEKINRAKDRRLKNFGYGYILISFVLERIPLLRPLHISLKLPGPRVPQMRQWIDLM